MLRDTVKPGGEKIEGGSSQRTALPSLPLA